jgi:hypothetical protein
MSAPNAAEPPDQGAPLTSGPWVIMVEIAVPTGTFCGGCGASYDPADERWRFLWDEGMRHDCEDDEESAPPPTLQAPFAPKTGAGLALDQVCSLWREWGVWPFESSGGPFRLEEPSHLRFRFWWNDKEILRGTSDERRLLAWRDWVLAQPDHADDATLADLLAQTQLLFRAHFPDLALPEEPGRVEGPLFGGAA